MSDDEEEYSFEDEDEEEDENPYSVKVLDNNKTCIEQPHCSQNNLLPNFPTGIVVIGKSGSGKSNAVFNLLSNKHMLSDYFDFIYLWAGVKPDKEMIKILEIPQENIKINFSEEDVKNIVNKLEKTVEKQGMKNTPKVLFIFDDILNMPKFLKSDTMTKIATQSRHANLSWIALSQYYKKLPPVIRSNASYYMIFPSSEAELIKISDELCPPNLSKKDFMKVAKHATKEKYQFLSINTKCNPNTMLRKNFDTVLTL